MKSKTPEPRYMKMAINLAREGMRRGMGGPFGALVVQGDDVIGESCNQVIHQNDPTAHAEVLAIRKACDHLGHFQLNGCDIYMSCEPCPMCLGAIYWARPDHVFYAALRTDAAQANFDDHFIYEDMLKPGLDRKIPMQEYLRDDALDLFEEWNAMDYKVLY